MADVVTLQIVSVTALEAYCQNRLRERADPSVNLTRRAKSGHRVTQHPVQLLIVFDDQGVHGWTR